MMQAIEAEINSGENHLTQIKEWLGRYACAQAGGHYPEMRSEIAVIEAHPLTIMRLRNDTTHELWYEDDKGWFYCCGYKIEFLNNTRMEETKIKFYVRPITQEFELASDHLLVQVEELIKRHNSNQDKIPPEMQQRVKAIEANPETISKLAGCTVELIKNNWLPRNRVKFFV